MKTSKPKPDFWSRVDFADHALVNILNHPGVVGDREFDSCFESYDGELVVTALMRRAAFWPGLRRGIEIMFQKGTGMSQWETVTYKWRHIREYQFAKVAKQVQRDAKEKADAQLAAMNSEAA